MRIILNKKRTWDDIGINQILFNRLFAVCLNLVSNPLFLNHFSLFQHAITKLKADCLFCLVFEVAIAFSVTWFSNRTGTSVDNGARKSNNWLDQWQSGKWSTGSRVQSFPRAFPSSSDVPVLLLNQPSVSLMGTRLQRSVGEARAARESRNKRYSRIPRLAWSSRADQYVLSLLWREKCIQLPPHPTRMRDLGKNYSQTKFPPVR